MRIGGARLARDPTGRVAGSSMSSVCSTAVTCPITSALAFPPQIPKSAAITCIVALAVLMTPGTPAPGWVPAPTM